MLTILLIVISVLSDKLHYTTNRGVFLIICAILLDALVEVGLIAGLILLLNA